MKPLKTSQLECSGSIPIITIMGRVKRNGCLLVVRSIATEMEGTGRGLSHLRTRPNFVPVNYWKLKAPRPNKVRGALLSVSFEVAYECVMERFGVPTLYRYVVGLFWICEGQPGVVDSVMECETLTEEGYAVFDRFFVDVRHRLYRKWGFTVPSVCAVVLLFK